MTDPGRRSGLVRFVMYQGPDRIYSRQKSGKRSDMMSDRMMKAAVFKGDGVLDVEMRPVPEVKNPDDVLIRINACSICGSDLHVLAVPPGQYAKPGTILGHEFVGIVEETGADVTAFKPGDKVVAEPNIRCGMCPECRRGNFNLCRNAVNTGQQRDGGFAEYCLMPQKQLYHVPADMPDKLGALAEPMACVMNGMIKINPQAYEKVVLFGAGAIGLLFVKALRRYGVRDIAVCETMPSRIEDARKAGASLVLNPMEDDLAAELEKAWGSLADIAIDAVGAGAVLEQIIDIVNSGARILIFGQNMTQHSTIRPGDINNKELTITATLSTKNSFEPAISILLDPSAAVEDLATHVVSLDEIHKGIELMRTKEAVKVVVVP